MAVGELIATVREDGDVTAVPVLVLVEVWPTLTEDERANVNDLFGREGKPAIVLPMERHAVPTVAAHASRTGHGSAQSIAIVLGLGATLATYAPSRYNGILDPYDVLDLR